MDIIIHWIMILSFSMMRPFGLLLILPVFTSIFQNPLIRNAVVLLLALPTAYALHTQITLLDQQPLLTLTLDYCKEMLIGLFMGFTLSIPFWSINMAGFIIDDMRGASIASVFNPALGTQSSLFGSLFSKLLNVLFLTTGSFNQVIHTLYGSYNTLKPGSHWLMNNTTIQFFVNEWHTMLLLSIGFAIPAMISMLMIDFSFGLINRSAQQLEVFFLSMPIKSLLALFLMAISLPFSINLLLKKINTFEPYVQHLLQWLSR